MSAVRIRLSPHNRKLTIGNWKLFLMCFYTFNKSQANKSLSRIPWHSEAMKGVSTNEMLRGAGRKLWSGGTRMRKLYILQIEFIDLQERNLVNWNISVTRGKESNSDSHSSGERKGNSLNYSLYKVSRVVGQHKKDFLRLGEMFGMTYGTRWKSCSWKL